VKAAAIERKVVRMVFLLDSVFPYFVPDYLALTVAACGSTARHAVLLMDSEHGVS
jgi:hypothetical protein